MNEEKIKIGISQGDINGIGLEVILKTLVEPELLDICTPVLFSSQKTINYYRKLIGLDEFHFNVIRELKQIVPKKINVLVCYEEEVPFEIGKSTKEGGKYALVSLQKAAEAAKQGIVDVLVTAPINKKNIQTDTFKFPGHSEFLASYFGFEKGAMMLMCADQLRVGLVTGHVPVSQISALITEEKVADKIIHLNKTLKIDFGIQKPKIAVLALNPHAGDEGVIGNEDATIVKPAINRLKENILVYGPYPADGFFGSETYKQFDAVLAMYHDQGLIPFKALSFNNGVNFTTGLPLIRTSPDHGVAYDIAGKNTANANSFRTALYTAIDLHRNRKTYQEASANPLKSNPTKKQTSFRE
ncbi:MAG: 4-hydroxythreonine-4-phosphate dehydrogenase PdxA [Bacteroidetes bacterium]|nr:4-hydroxythreonine-4-phosphate dehydrogenase PdxA [Bacteroidota bacterium]